MKTQNHKNSLSPVAKFASIFALAALIALASGCGGGGSSLTSNPTPTPAGANSAQVRFGDAPADSVISFEVSVSSLSLTPAGGGARLLLQFQPTTALNSRTLQESLSRSSRAACRRARSLPRTSLW